ncbi:MAG TPA: HAMP domain-containing sensor histidine kinase [Phototrophicaceae bacterium]|nr:HAMP domain-containing sensor histidine kinase [Phototrophicaceae bacterium]
MSNSTPPEAWLAGILDVAIDAIVAIDQTQQIIFFNQGAEHIFGYLADEMLGQPLSLLLPARFTHVHAHYIQKFATAPHTSQHMHERSTIWGRRRDGSEFPAEASISKLDRNGELVFAIIMRDITVRRNMEESLRRALAEAQELSELRSRFISMVSHELRTPLAIIQSSSDMVETYGARMTDEKKGGYHNNIKQQVKQLTHLLEDTLAISRAETVGLEFKPQTSDLAACCRSIAERIQLATNATCQIIFTDNEACREARYDEALLSLILNNLLSNAVKYSPEGSIVRLNLQCSETFAIIQVSDRGIGIPDDDHQHLFENFYRGTNVGPIPGTGLGLAIVKQAVKAHQGTILFESQEGMGTTFIVTIPIT